MRRLCFQVKQLPDLSLNKYQSLSDTGVQGVLKRHESFLRQWHGISYASNTSFHLLYIFLPQEDIGNQLKLFLILQGDKENLEQIEPLLFCSPLSDYYCFEKASIPNTKFKAGAALSKKGLLAKIYNPSVAQIEQVYYVPRWEMNESGRLYDLFRMMDTISSSYNTVEPCAFRIDVYPSSVAEITREQFLGIIKHLRGDNEVRITNDTASIKDDYYAKEISKEYEDWIKKIETSPHFRVNIYGFAESFFKAKVVLNAAGSEAVGEGDFSIKHIDPDKNGLFEVYSYMEEKPIDDFNNNQKKASIYKSWSTTYCLSELIPFFRLPALFDGETIGIQKETAPVQMNSGLYLGKDINGFPVYFELKDMTRHAFFTGMPGSGKTCTMLHLISQLRKNSIPFLVLEPAKKEYRALLGFPEMKGVYLFSPYLQSRFPLQLNPLEFPKGTRLSEHINTLLEVFEGTFGFQGPTYHFLSKSIQKSYTNLGWDLEDSNYEGCNLAFPSLQDVYNNLQNEIDASSYNSEIKGDVRAFLQVRLGGLMERDAGKLFNSNISTLAPEEWLSVSAIVELEVLGEQAKNFFVLLVCHYILETLRAAPNGGVNSDGEKLPVRHVIFLEEAHNLIAPSTIQQSAELVDPKISATAYIIKMLAEVRALRESIVIADQLPSALASEVTKNTGLKIVHRLTAQDDREIIGAAISASPLQLEQMASLTNGKAFIYHEKTLKPFEIQIAEWKSPKLTFDFSDDESLYQYLMNTNNIIRSITVSFKNWKIKQLKKVDDEIFDLLDRCRKLNEKSIAETKICKAERELLRYECEKLLKKCNRMERVWMIQKDGHPLRAEFELTYKYIGNMKKRLQSLSFID